MAPPSGASKPPRGGQAKKPVVPAIPYLLQKRKSPPVVAPIANGPAPAPAPAPAGSVSAPTAKAPASTPANPSMPSGSKPTANTNGSVVTAAAKVAPPRPSAASSAATATAAVPTPAPTKNGAPKSHSRGHSRGPSKVTPGRSFGSTDSGLATGATNDPAASVLPPREPRENNNSHRKATKHGQKHPQAPSKATAKPDTKAAAHLVQQVQQGQQNLHVRTTTARVAKAANGHHRQRSSLSSSATDTNAVNGTIEPRPQPVSAQLDDNKPAASPAGVRDAPVNVDSPTHTNQASLTRNRPPALQANGFNGHTNAGPEMAPPTGPLSGPPTGPASANMHPYHPHQHPHPGPPQHQPHASAGSHHVMFGGFQHSTESSPGPPPPGSGGFLPPPPPPPNGPANGPANGFTRPPPGFGDRFQNHPHPPAMHLASDFTSVTTAANPPAFAGFPPANDLGPDTPHSFQASPSPLFPDENGHVDQRRGVSPALYPPHPPLFHPMLPVPDVDNFDGIVDYIAGQFRDPVTSDCFLELRCTASPGRAFRIPAHTLILGRSPVLKHMMEEQSRMAQHTSETRGQHMHNGHEAPTTHDGKRVFFVHTDDLYMQPDAFTLAVQRLYCHPLLPMPVDMLPPTPESFIPRMEFAMAYTAAGHLLQMEPVAHRGMELASRNLTWHTLTRAVEFCLFNSTTPDVFPAVADTPADLQMPFKYGQAVSILMNAIIEFIVHSWPADFVFDASVGPLPRYNRVPYVPDSPSPAAPAAPAIARGSHPISSNPRLSHIQFGDITASPPQQPQTTNDTPSPHSTALSLVLINLPFLSLKYILESNLPAKAQEVFHAIVAERETRRKLVLDLVAGGSAPDARAIWDWLHLGGSVAFGHAKWSALGWVEEVSVHGSGRIHLSRKWGFEPPMPSPEPAVEA